MLDLEKVCVFWVQLVRCYFIGNVQGNAFVSDEVVNAWSTL